MLKRIFDLDHFKLYVKSFYQALLTTVTIWVWKKNESYFNQLFISDSNQEFI